jgi:hypothetical protein
MQKLQLEQKYRNRGQGREKQSSVSACNKKFAVAGGQNLATERSRFPWHGTFEATASLQLESLTASANTVEII